MSSTSRLGQGLKKSPIGQKLDFANHPYLCKGLNKMKNMKLIKATEAEIQRFIAQHTAWSVEEDKLHCQYVFNNFIEAFSFMTKVALIAESLNHHPEWFNTYKQVAINLITHEVGGISKRDFELARKIQDITNAKY
jgi:4a-hydroxytetrahydrobiopterin dehydratase